MLRVVASQFCPGMGLDFVCSNSTPNGAWVSNVTYNPPDDNGEIFFTWAPDPQIPQEDRGYRLFIRNLDSGTSQYMTSPSVCSNCYIYDCISRSACLVVGPWEKENLSNAAWEDIRKLGAALLVTG